MLETVPRPTTGPKEETKAKKQAYIHDSVIKAGYEGSKFAEYLEFLKRTVTYVCERSS